MTLPLVELDRLAALVGETLAPALSVTTHAAADDELVEALRVVERLGRWADAARVILAGEVGRRAEHESGDDPITARYGCGSAAELVERATAISRATACGRLRDAKAVTSRLTQTGQARPAPLAHVRATLAAGRLSADALTTIVDALRPLQERCSADQLEAAEIELVAAAAGDSDHESCAIHELRVMASVWALFLDPDGSLPDENDERRRGFRISRRSRDGLRRLSAEVTDDVAAQLDRLLDAHLNPRVGGPRFNHGFGGADSSSDDDAAHIHDPRTIDQKRHDAFGSILSAAAASAETPALGGAAPTLVVTVAEADLTAADGVAFVDGADGLVPVSASIARHIGCHGAVHRATLDINGSIRGLTVQARVFTHWQRKAIAARDGGCVIPGCTVPASWCEVHHVVEHARGGPTGTDNGVLLCWHHHRGLETSGWQIRMVEGMPRIRPPGWIDPQRRWREPNRSQAAQLRRARSA